MQGVKNSLKCVLIIHIGKLKLDYMQQSSFFKGTVWVKSPVKSPNPPK
jgi:hypothetical protein